MFSGIGLGAFLYVVGHSVNLNLTPDQISQIPFDLTSLLHVVWLIGLIPALTGFGRVIAGFTVRLDRPDEIRTADEQPLRIGEPDTTAFVSTPSFTAPRDNEATVFASRPAPDSVTDRTTNILEHQVSASKTGEMK